jgi:hypothetical protein
MTEGRLCYSDRRDLPNQHIVHYPERGESCLGDSSTTFRFYSGRLQKMVAETGTRSESIAFTFMVTV